MQIRQIRPWVQLLFTFAWLAPFGLQFKRVPTCVFHCYACPAATCACPIGIMAQMSAIHVFPWLAIGVIVLVAGAIGSLSCAWACPFGFLQDLLARVPTPKVRLPNWLGYGRYMSLLALVVFVPYLWGEEHPLFFCRVCPAGALEASVPRVAMSAFGDGEIMWMSWYKAAIAVGMIGAALFIRRPWCSVLCPLGGLLALFNRFSVFYLRFNSTGCSECNLCRSRCDYGVLVDLTINNTTCIRCLECTACPAIKPAVAPLRKMEGAEEAS